MPVAILEQINLTQLHRWGLQSKEIRSAEGRIHVLDGPGKGDAPPLVLVHGVSARGSQYRKLVEHVRADHKRLIIPDLLAHGLSETPSGPLDTSRIYRALLEVLDALVDQPVVVFGNSLGGYLAIRYAVDRPQRVSALVVHSPGGGPLAPLHRAQLLDRFRVDNHSRALELVDRSLTDVGNLRHLAALVVQRQLSPPHIQALLQSVTEQDELRPEQLDHLSMPVLLLWGQRDRVMEEEQFQFFQNYLPKHALIVRPENYGHSPHLERAPDLAKRIHDFVQSQALLRQG